MNKTQTTATWSRNPDGSYTFTSESFIADAWQFRSDYGDLQWGCDIRYIDGRQMDCEFLQMDYLKDVKAALIRKSENFK